MWKLISLSALLIAARAADIEDFYGDWIEVAFYPVSTYVPLCIHFSFAKGTDNVQCTYADGRNISLVQVYMATETTLVNHQSVALRVVDTLAEVMPTLNISVKCGDKVIGDNNRAVVRMVKEDYFILYGYISPSMEHTRSEIEQNSALLFARNVVSENKLFEDMLSIEDLKNRRGAQMCVKENYGGFKSTENEVGNK